MFVITMLLILALSAVAYHATENDKEAALKAIAPT